MVKQRDEEGGIQLERALRRETKLHTELVEMRQSRSDFVRRWTDIIAGDAALP